MDQRHHGVGHGVLHRPHGGGELAVAAAAGAEQQAEPVGLVGDPSEPRGEAPLGLLARVRRGGRRRDDRGAQPVTDVVEQREVQLALGREVLVEHRLGDARRLGHVVHRRAVEPPPREHAESRSEELLAPGGGGESDGHGYRTVTPALNGRPVGCEPGGYRPAARSSFSAAFTA